MADGLITPDEMAALNLRNLLLHEVGHALGLVPTSGKAGGLAQDKWHDAGHPGHCGTKTCVMYWQNGLAGVGFAAQLKKDAPFEHPKEFDCMVYLFACDLSDVRKLPN